MLSVEALKRYKIRRQSELHICYEALKSSNLTILEQIGHKLKGNGLTVGFPEISLFGQQLEQSAKNKDMSKLNSLVEWFENWISEKFADVSDEIFG